MEPLEVPQGSLWTPDCPGAMLGLLCQDDWGWSSANASHDARVRGCNRRTVYFHPNWSNGTAAARGERVLNAGPPSRFYWEIKITDRIFGTSMMFGIGTAKCRLHSSTFVNLIGEDENGWGLSHKGLLWHNNKSVEFARPFRENKPTTIGMLYDGYNGTLTYYKDGDCLGIAFRGLNQIEEKLYPIVCSTAAKTEMTLANMRRDFFNLKDRCRQVILQSIEPKKIPLLGLPPQIEKFLILRSDISDSNDSLDSCNVTSQLNQPQRFPYLHQPRPSNPYEFFCKPYKIRSLSVTDF